MVYSVVRRGSPRSRDRRSDGELAGGGARVVEPGPAVDAEVQYDEVEHRECCDDEPEDEKATQGDRLSWPFDVLGTVN